MSRFNLIILFCLSLSSCSITTPYVDRKRNAGQPIERLYSGKSTPENPAICYNSMFTTIQEVQKLANEECQKQKTGTTAQITKNTSWSCSLLSPNHLYFTCK